MAEPATVAPADPARRLVRAAPWLAVAYAAGLLALPHLRVESAALAAGLSVVSYLVFTAVLLLLTAALSAAPLPRWGVVAMLCLGTAGWLGLSYGLGDKPPPIAGVAATLCMVFAMAGAGRALVVFCLREANLLPVALVLMAVVDTWGVTIGFTARVAEHTPQVIAKASAAVPAIATTHATAFPLTDLSVGPGDILFMAMVLTLVVREGFDLRRNLLWIYGLMTAGLGLVLGLGAMLPGLVFVGAAGLIANWKRFSYTSEERRSLQIATAVMIPLLVVAALAFRAATREEPSTGGQNHGSDTLRLR